MKKVIIEITDIEKIEDEQILLFNSGFKWYSQKDQKENILKGKYNFHNGQQILIYDNLIYIISGFSVTDIENECVFFKNVITFLRFYKINKILKKDI